MTKKSQTTPVATVSSVPYYLGRVLQRVVLCITITLTGIYWAFLVARTVLTIVNSEATSAISQNQTLEVITNGLKAHTLKWAVLAAALPLLLLTIARFRKYEKPLVVDGVVIALFCLVSALLAEAFMKLAYSSF